MRLSGKKIIQIVSNDFEDLELWYPVLRLREEGATVDIAGEKAGERKRTVSLRWEDRRRKRKRKMRRRRKEKKRSDEKKRKEEERWEGSRRRKEEERKEEEEKRIKERKRRRKSPKNWQGRRKKKKKTEFFFFFLFFCNLPRNHIFPFLLSDLKWPIVIMIILNLQ